MQTETSLLEWWKIISEKRCDDYTHSQEDRYNEAPKGLSRIKMNSKILYIQKPNPRRWSNKIHVGPIGLSLYINLLGHNLCIRSMF